MIENSAIFLDRDGVLNKEAGEHIKRTSDLHLLPGAMDAVARLTRAGCKVFIFTNQSGVGRGYMTLEDLDAIHAYLRSKVEEVGGRIAGIYACTHHPEAGCDCRKPKPGLLRLAAKEYDVDLSASYAIGDSARDIAAAAAAGCRTVLVLSGHTTEYQPSGFSPAPDHVFADLHAFVDWLLPGPA